MKHIVLVLFLACGLIAGHRLAYADTGSGSGSGSNVTITAVAVVTSSQLHDPTTDPLAAIADVRGLKARWPLLVLAIGIMLAKVVHFAGDKLGWLGKWLAVGRRAMIVAGAAALLSTLYDSLASGGTWSSALLVLGGAVLALLKPHAPGEAA